MRRAKEMVVISVVVVMAIWLMVWVYQVNVATGNQIDAIVTEFNIPENAVTKKVYEESYGAENLYNDLTNGVLAYEGGYWVVK